MKQLSVIGKNVALQMDDGAEYKFNILTVCAGTTKEGYFVAAALREKGKIDVWFLLPELVAETIAPDVAVNAVIPADRYRVLNLKDYVREAWFANMVDIVVSAF